MSSCEKEKVKPSAISNIPPFVSKCGISDTICLLTEQHWVWKYKYFKFSNSEDKLFEYPGGVTKQIFYKDSVAIWGLVNAEGKIKKNESLSFDRWNLKKDSLLMYNLKNDSTGNNYNIKYKITKITKDSLVYSFGDISYTYTFVFSH